MSATHELSEEGYPLVFTPNSEIGEPGVAEPLDEAQAAMRWRRAILKLSKTLQKAAVERQDLSVILMEAMHNALEQLLVYGNEDALMALEEWLDQEAEDLENSAANDVSAST